MGTPVFLGPGVSGWMRGAEGPYRTKVRGAALAWVCAVPLSLVLVRATGKSGWSKSIFSADSYVPALGLEEGVELPEGKRP